MARSTPADYREFVRVSVDLPLNPKLATIDNPAAGWAYVVSLCYCGQNLTDGSFPMTVLLRLAGVETTIAGRLVDAGLWHLPEHSCARCPEPMPGMAVVHDYLVHQRSADEAHSLRDARREAGRKGAATRWSSADDGKRHSKSDGKRNGKTVAPGVADAWQTDSNSMAEVEVEEEKKTTSSSTTSAKPPRQDVEQLCAHFADLVEANTERRPNVTQRWRDAARLLLDNDLNREPDPLALAMRLADWTAKDEFWRSNVLSIPKFREQFSRLRLKARQQWEQQSGGHLRLASGGGPQRIPTTTQRVHAALAHLEPEEP
jgi:hypothetical protein